MKTLVVFDSFLTAEKTNLTLFNKGDIVYLFPLTSQGSLSTVLEQKLKEAGCEARKMQTALMINAAAERLRDRYMQFIAGLSRDIRYKEKNLRELFSVDNHATLWWFSLISEKSTLKSKAFNNLAQLDSIIKSSGDNAIEEIIFWCRNKNLQDALAGYASERSIRFRIFPKGLLGGLKAHISGSQKIFYLRHILFLLNFAANFMRRTWKIKRAIARPGQGLGTHEGEMLVITPYPNIDIALAQKGIFRNKFYPFLQEALESKGENICWIAMNIDNNSISFSESLEYAKGFIKNGCSIFFLEEFNSAGGQIKALATMLKNGLKFLRIENSLSKAHTFGNYNFYPLLKDDWYSSFVGQAGYAGLLYYNMFKSMFDRFKVKKCLYFYEMQTWEKALICARDAVGSNTSLYGYQAGTISRMLLNLFNDPSEMADDTLYALPRPDRVICSGRLPYTYMRESGWPEENLLVVEAIRYSYLKGFLREKWHKKKDVVLLAFSISPEESSSILSIAYESFKDFKDIEVWVKPHPFLELKRVFELSGISEEGFPFKVKKGLIEDFLPEARIVIAGESGVVIEALAFGCEIVIVNVPEWINISLLRYVKTETVKTVTSPEELRQVVLNKFNEEYRPEIYDAEYRRIIGDFFYLNHESDTPSRFLEFLNNIDTGQENRRLYNEKMV